jgi:regulator of protease activity HflC (stomatin/prohibitin superfamily)
MPQGNALPGLIFMLLFALALLIGYASWSVGDYATAAAIAIAGLLVASIIANSIKVANQWERVVVLRLGRFCSLAGPGLFFIVPILETVAYRIDIRVITSTFKAEKTLTRDTVPSRRRCGAVLASDRPDESGARRRRL